jgi:hypothetical protein
MSPATVPQVQRGRIVSSFCWSLMRLRRVTLYEMRLAICTPRTRHLRNRCCRGARI